MEEAHELGCGCIPGNSDKSKRQHNVLERELGRFDCGKSDDVGGTYTTEKVSNEDNQNPLARLFVEAFEGMWFFLRVEHGHLRTLVQYRLRRRGVVDFDIALELPRWTLRLGGSLFDRHGERSWRKSLSLLLLLFEQRPLCFGARWLTAKAIKEHEEGDKGAKKEGKKIRWVRENRRRCNGGIQIAK